MSLQTRLSDLATAIGTDIKLLRTYITGSSTGDLTGLTTTAKTSLIAAINEVKAGSAGAPPAATETTAGIAQVATQTEVNAGTIDTDMVTPLKLSVSDAARNQPKSTNLTALAAFTTDTDVALAANSDTRLATQKAVKAYADSLLDANNAMQYKGLIDASASPNYPAASAGWTYKISVAGKIGGASGPNVEVGDTIISLIDGQASGTQAAVGANWDILQSNIDGAVTGPATSVTTDLATFNGTSGKVVQDSGVKISVDGTMASNVDTLVPTVKAMLTYLAATFYTQTQLGNYDTDLAAAYATAKT